MVKKKHDDDELISKLSNSDRKSDDIEDRKIDSIQSSRMKVFIILFVRSWWSSSFDHDPVNYRNPFKNHYENFLWKGSMTSETCQCKIFFPYISLLVCFVSADDSNYDFEFSRLHYSNFYVLSFIRVLDSDHDRLNNSRRSRSYLSYYVSVSLQSTTRISSV